MARPLSLRQRNFIREYLTDFNATKAATRAGYSEKTAHVQGCDLLKRPNIQQGIRDAQADLVARTEITQEKVLLELAKIGFSDIRKVFNAEGGILPPDQWPDDLAPAVAGLEVVTRNTGLEDKRGNPIVDHVHKFRLWDKTKALEQIGKHIGMFTGEAQKPAENKAFDGWQIDVI